MTLKRKSRGSYKLKIAPEIVNNVTVLCVHRVRYKKGNNNNHCRLTVVKFELYKHKELVKSKRKELKGTNSDLNDRFHHKVLKDIKICQMSEGNYWRKENGLHLLLTDYMYSR